MLAKLRFVLLKCMQIFLDCANEPGNGMTVGVGEDWGILLQGITELLQLSRSENFRKQSGQLTLMAA